LLRELARSDRAVSELTLLVDEPQNLVSYHLRQLRDGGLVSHRRSSADGRDVYYALDLEACGRQLYATGRELHPALLPPLTTESTARTRRRPRVLFLCTGNSARSQMAEAFLMHRSDGAFQAASAGSNPKPLHPNAVRVMAERGIDISTNRSKHLDELTSQRFAMVITLCDRVREICPEFPRHPELVHWSMSDPASEGGNDRASLPAFERTATELETRIRFLISRLTTTPDREARHAARSDRQRSIHGRRRR
jgi:ArsR family transcriptional regulator, arsenate/arsenite/antimonite-responsive transcriptional repressor / arsenate reductase (thioredoxin)